jgi:Uma2 family endonuclease
MIVKDRREDGRRFKLLYFYEDQHYELYDLTGDPGEKTNLIGRTAPTGETATIVEDLRRDLVAWLDRQQPAYPTDAATGKRVPPPIPLDKARYDVGRFEAKPKGNEDEGEEGTGRPSPPNRKNRERPKAEDSKGG